MGQLNKLIVYGVLSLLVFCACNKDHTEYFIPEEKKLQIKSGGSELSFYVPDSYDSVANVVYVKYGYLSVEPGSVKTNQSFFWKHYMVETGDIPNTYINGGKNGLVFFTSSAESLDKDALIKFPFNNVTIFNQTHNYKPYRIKISNVSAMLSDLKTRSNWEELAITRIDTTAKLVHFKTDQLDSYIYCLAKFF